MDNLIGEIRAFAGNYAPVGWAICDGSLLPTRQYAALFSLLGYTYGGDNVNKFALPDLRGRLLVHKDSAPEMLVDVVQLDETLVGGKNKNRHADKKIPNSQGRSSKDKTPVFGARGLCGRIKTQVIPDAEAATIIPIVEKWVKEGSIMVTDEWSSYKPLGERYFHITVSHKDGQYASGAFSSNGVENFWSLFKRGIIGIYHQISPKHLQRYANEFGYRYNTRWSKANERFDRTIKRANTARLSYKALTRED